MLMAGYWSEHIASENGSCNIIRILRNTRDVHDEVFRLAWLLGFVSIQFNMNDECRMFEFFYLF